jgi:hypothetical protein
LNSRGEHEAETIEELIECVVDGGVQPIKSGATVVWHEGVVWGWTEHGRREWRLDALGRLQKQQADTEALGCQAVVWVFGTLRTSPLARGLAKS